MKKNKRILIGIIFSLVVFSMKAQDKRNEELRTEKGLAQIGGLVKFLQPSNGSVYAHAYLKVGIPKRLIYVTGSQYKNVTMKIKKIEYQTDKTTGMEVPLLVVGLEGQKKIYDVYIEVTPAIRQNEIEIVR